jgi:5-methylcytosine-specific restriction enzyme subunit McrC
MSDSEFKVIELSEWKTRELPEQQLTADDRVMVKALSSDHSRRLKIDELRRGIRISTFSWIGVVRFSQFEVRVVPKLAGHNLRVVEMMELTLGVDTLRRCPAARTMHNEGAQLLDLIALLLVEESERVLRAGLMSDYVEEEDDLPVLRGRLLADRQLLERFGRVDRVICRYDERKQDVLENQLLAAALDACARRVSHPLVRRKARQLGNVLHGVCDPLGLDLQAARHEIFYSRMNEHYRDAHQLAWLVLDCLGITDLFSPGPTRIFAFMLDMNQLFERFVLAVLEWLLTGSAIDVRYQKRDRSIIVDAVTSRPYSRVIPDFLLTVPNSRSERLALDAKYKLYDTVRVSPSDIYQAFLYAYAYGNEDLPSPNAGLIYPSEDPAGGFHELRVRGGGQLTDAMVSVVGLPIPSVLDEIKAGVAGPGMASIKRVLTPFLARVDTQVENGQSVETVAQ